LLPGTADSRPSRRSFHPSPRPSPQHPSDYKTRIKPAASDEYFIKMIRLDRAALFELRNALRPLLKRMPTPMKPNPLSVGEQLWIALRYLASGAPLPTIGEAVHYSTTTVHRCVRDVCCAIITTKRHELVKWPNDDDGIMHLVRRPARVLAPAHRPGGGQPPPTPKTPPPPCPPTPAPPHAPQVAGFRSFAGIPNIVGAIDGSNIGIVTPPFSGDAYIDRKGHTSIKLQAVCDADMLFMDLYCGPSGRWHDQRAFRASPLWEEPHEGALGARLQRAALEVPVPPATPGGPARVARLPLQVVADSAYTAVEFVLPAFQDSTADVGPRRTFNLAHARTRNVIERAFGLLKARWRILLRRIDTKLSTTRTSSRRAASSTTSA
jgi:transposase